MDRLALLHSALEDLGNRSHGKPLSLLLEIPRRRFVFHAADGILLHASGPVSLLTALQDGGYLQGSPLPQALAGREEDDHTVARLLYPLMPEVVVLGVTRQAAAQLQVAAMLVSGAPKGRMAWVFDHPELGFWRQVGGGVRLSSRVLDLLLGVVDPARKRTAMEWDDPFLHPGSLLA